MLTRRKTKPARTRGVAERAAENTTAESAESTQAGKCRRAAAVPVVTDFRTSPRLVTDFTLM
jgi:hypothetical protein